MKKPKKGFKKKLATINFGSFPGYCLFCYGYSYQEIVEQLKKNKRDEWITPISEDVDRVKIEQGSYQAFYRIVENVKSGEKKHYFYIFFREEFIFKDMSYIILAHEVLHICQFYLPTVLDRNTEIEAEAYLHSHIMKQCLDAIRS